MPDDSRTDGDDSALSTEREQADDRSVHSSPAPNPTGPELQSPLSDNSTRRTDVELLTSGAENDGTRRLQEQPARRRDPAQRGAEIAARSTTMSQEEIQAQVAAQLAAEVQKLNDEFEKRKAEAEAADLRREEAAQKRQDKATQDLIKFFSDQSAQAAKDRAAEDQKRADAELLRTAAQSAKDAATEKVARWPSTRRRLSARSPKNHSERRA